MSRNLGAFHCSALWITTQKYSRAICKNVHRHRNNERRCTLKCLKCSFQTNKEDNLPSTEELLNPTRVASLQRRYEYLLESYEQTGDEGKKKVLESKLLKLERELEREKRSVMSRGLRSVFVTQALVSLVVGGLLAADKFPLVEEVPLVLRALGFWMVWLFTIPSLRARKPIPAEKSALNVAFLACPAVNICIPFFSKDTFFVWLVNVCLILVLYGYYFFVADEAVRTQSQLKIRGILK